MLSLTRALLAIVFRSDSWVLAKGLGKPIARPTRVESDGEVRVLNSIRALLAAVLFGATRGFCAGVQVPGKAVSRV